MNAALQAAKTTISNVPLGTKIAVEANKRDNQKVP